MEHFLLISSEEGATQAGSLGSLAIAFSLQLEKLGDP